MPDIEQELEHVLVPLDHSPRQRRVPFWARIGISHVDTLDKALDEKEVVFYINLSIVGDRVHVKVPLTAFLRRALVSLSAMTRWR